MFQMYFNGISRLFKDYSRIFQGCYSRVFQKYFKAVLRKFQENFKGFQAFFKEIAAGMF